MRRMRLNSPQLLLLGLVSVLAYSCGDEGGSGAPTGQDGNDVPPCDELGVFTEADINDKLTPDVDAAIGVFSGGGGLISEFVGDADEKRDGVSMRTTVTVSGIQWAGWFIQAGTFQQGNVTKNMSFAEGGALQFWVKTPINLEVGIRSNDVTAGLERSKVLLSTYGVLLNDVWQEVRIPIGDLVGTSANRRADLKQMKVLFVVASNLVSGGTGGRPVIFWIDDVRWRSSGCG